MSHAANAAGHNCPNCGSPAVRNFCPECGQSEEEGHAPTVGHFLHELTHEILHVDGKIARTLWALLFQPGKLTEEYWSGRVVSWLRPIRIFLIAAAIHLYFAAGIGPFNLQMLAEVGPNGARHLIVSENLARNAGKDGRVPIPEPEQHEIQERFTHVYNQLRYTAPLWLAALSWVRFRRRQPYFVNHLIAALHLYAFFYVLAVITGELRQLSGWFNLLGLATLMYVPLSMRRLFKVGWVRASFDAMYVLAMMFLIEMGLAIVGVLRSGLELG